MLRPRVLLADDVSACLDSYARILQDEFEIVGKATTGQDAIALSRELKPDILVLDIAMSNMDGIAAARQLRLADDPPRIIFISTFQDADYLDAAEKAGGLGFVLKPRAARDLPTAILLAMEGRSFVSPGVCVKR
jgi:DNA-binding NarL/FixJ family response regulator